MRHIVDPKTNDWYHLDEKYQVYNCSCKKPPNERIELCLSQCEHLTTEGELRQLKREINDKKKELDKLSKNS